MLKYVFAFFAFVMVSLAPLYADEGYIPFFPDFLEPDGIGFRGPASIKAQNCWADQNCSGDLESTVDAMPYGTSLSAGSSYTRSSPVTIEYRKDYFYKKLFYSQTFADFGQTLTTGPLRQVIGGGNANYHNGSNSDSTAFLNQFLTAEEKSQIIADYVLWPSGFWPYYDFLTESKYILFGKGFGLDLWLFEGSWGPFLMIHDTSLTMRYCGTKNFQMEQDDLDSMFIVPTGCDLYPQTVSNLDKQRYFGFAAGTVTDLSIVFLQTENWRISMDTTTVNFNLFLDSNFKPVSYRGLKFYPEYSSSSTLKCSGGRYRYYQTAQPSGDWQEIDCINSKGENHRKSSDYTHGLKITYFFR